MHDCVFLAVSDPDVGGSRAGDRCSEAVPIGVIGNHQWQFYRLLTRTRTHAHPAGGKASQRIGEASRPWLSQRAGWTQCDRAGQFGLVRVPRQVQPAEIDPATLVIARDLLHRTVEIDWLVIAS